MPSDDERWMLDAIEAAREGAEAGEVPIGAVVADRGGAVIGRAVNRSRTTGDRTAHAEMVALRAACRESDDDRSDWTLVTTLEPCLMCLGAATELGVGRIVYALEAPANGAVERVRDDRTPEISGGVLRDRARAVLLAWLDGEPEGRGVAFVRALVDATGA